MKRILSIVVLFALLVSFCSEAYAWRPKLLKKMTKPPVFQKHKA
jgi:hypothetical protein